jgi:hypothetical protein
MYAPEQKSASVLYRNLEFEFVPAKAQITDNKRISQNKAGNFPLKIPFFHMKSIV